jgi:hypothetical protein
MGPSSSVGVALYGFDVCVVSLAGDYGIARISGVTATAVSGTEFVFFGSHVHFCLGDTSLLKF